MEELKHNPPLVYSMMTTNVEVAIPAGAKTTTCSFQETAVSPPLNVAPSVPLAEPIPHAAGVSCVAGPSIKANPQTQGSGNKSSKGGKGKEREPKSRVCTKCGQTVFGNFFTHLQTVHPGKTKYNPGEKSTGSKSTPNAVSEQLKELDDKLASAGDVIKDQQEEIVELQTAAPGPVQLPPKVAKTVAEKTKSLRERLDHSRAQDDLERYKRTTQTPTGLEPDSFKLPRFGKRKGAFVIGKLENFVVISAWPIYLFTILLFLLACWISPFEYCSTETFTHQEFTSEIYECRFSMAKDIRDTHPWFSETADAIGHAPYKCQNGDELKYGFQGRAYSIMKAWFDYDEMLFRGAYSCYDSSAPVGQKGICLIHKGNMPWEVPHGPPTYSYVETCANYGETAIRMFLQQHLDLFHSTIEILRHPGSADSLGLLFSVIFQYILMTFGISFRLNIVLLGWAPLWLVVRTILMALVTLPGITVKQAKSVNRLSFNIFRAWEQLSKPVYARLVAVPIKDKVFSSIDFSPEFDRDERFAPQHYVQYQIMTDVKILGCHIYSTNSNLVPVPWHDEKDPSGLKKVVLNVPLISTILNRKTMLAPTARPFETLATALRLLSANAQYCEAPKYLAKGRSVYRDMSLVFGAVIMRSVSQTNEVF